jgi:hypothetical protein
MNGSFTTITPSHQVLGVKAPIFVLKALSFLLRKALHEISPIH